MGLGVHAGGCPPPPSYADDTEVLWCSREWVEREAPVLFADFGLEMHVKKLGEDKASKSVVLFYLLLRQQTQSDQRR
jgi:hypothetical protein